MNIVKTIALTSASNANEELADLTKKVKKQVKIDWKEKEELNLLLLELIKEEKAHIPKRGEADKLWTQVSKRFWMQDSVQDIKNKSFDATAQNPGRRFKERYEELRAEAKKHPSWGSRSVPGNKSAIEGEKSKIFKTMCELEQEIEANEEAAKDKKVESNVEKQKRLEEIEKTGMNNPLKPVKRLKTIDGSISGLIR
jgi:hypothetical protein